jgi:uroporphyrin-III C-methyltransferase
MIMGGKVYLVGAGPGDPELLTRKAWRILQSADVVLHDELVSKEILHALPPAAQVVNVGKRCGAQIISQAEVNELMVTHARSGHIVARLKSGDPSLFGRAGEEMDALRDAGIEFEVIPGVTSALGAAASAHIPLTDRRRASRVVFTTAHHAEGTGLFDEHDVAGTTTYVIYMPGNRYFELSAELQTAGISEATPCVVVSRATTPEEDILRTTVGKLPFCPTAIAPSLLIVGVVASISEETDALGGELAGPLRAEVLSLADQHPHHHTWRSGVE